MTHSCARMCVPPGAHASRSSIAVRGREEPNRSVASLLQRVSARPWRNSGASCNLAYRRPYETVGSEQRQCRFHDLLASGGPDALKLFKACVAYIERCIAAGADSSVARLGCLENLTGALRSAPDLRRSAITASSAVRFP